jgi:hypothetical protein
MNSAIIEQSPCFLLPFSRFFLLPFCFPLLTWNPPCCDRILSTLSQVARKLISPFPSPYPYTPHSKIPTPLGLPDPNIHSIRTASQTWLTRSRTYTIFCHVTRMAHSLLLNCIKILEPWQKKLYENLNFLYM